MTRFNDWLAVRLSAGFSTMEAFYVFLLFPLIPTVWPESMSVIQFISSGVLQLVALPLLAVGSVINGRRAEERAEQDHRAIMAEVETLKTIVSLQRETLALLRNEEGREPTWTTSAI